eukprot:gnl/Dysnectes_brevis/1619_a1839_1727.p1 GENE.gnl/Dysnectes_brevis/1619_a1839_1727~~gnl/Dysnectes_brevis/1619_a1839_1727.p1  ORF type:complete len:456 (+),score=166.33 gnl/Dysnectes_brevis/1619_a1839_1727:38-1405(+)
MLFVLVLVFIALAHALELKDISHERNYAYDSDLIQVFDMKRTLDLTTQYIREVSHVEFEIITDDRVVDFFFYSVPFEFRENIAFTRAQIISTGEYLPITPVLMTGKYVEDIIYLAVAIPEMEEGDGLTLLIEVQYANLWDNSPPTKAFGDPRDVEVTLWAQPQLAYDVSTQYTQVLFPPNGHLSHTDEAMPSSFDGEHTLSLGPYEYQKPFEAESFSVRARLPHEQVGVKSTRAVRLGRAGDMRVSDRLSFTNMEAPSNPDRVDLMRKPAGALSALALLLPADSTVLKVYDRIGNISTSVLVPTKDSMQLAVKPRFPMAGGWSSNVWVESIRRAVVEEDEAGRRHASFRAAPILQPEGVYDMEFCVYAPPGAMEVRVDLPFDAGRHWETETKGLLDFVPRPGLCFALDPMAAVWLTMEVHMSWTPACWVSQAAWLAGAVGAVLSALWALRIMMRK